MNKRKDQLLSKIDILDIENWLGTILSSRRSAEIALQDYGQSEWEEFVSAKHNFWQCNQCGYNLAPSDKGTCPSCGAFDTNDHRTQSNNSILFQVKPTREELTDIFKRMHAAGGSEPGFVNAVAARKRASWFQTMNPCAEILLPNKGFCNLVETNVAAFKGNHEGLLRCLYIMARANYRQTCVDLNDGVLQESWHANNQFLRLCGVGLTGVGQRPDLGPEQLQEMRKVATEAANTMADELGTPRPKNVTTVKPSGTLSKIMDCTEGLHLPLGKYIFNNIGFSVHDPIVPKLREAGYKVFPKPSDPSTVLATLPVCFEGVELTEVDGTPVNLESAVEQLERYKLYQTNWTDQNTSVTISYSMDGSEDEEIIDWLLENWEHYVGVSFIYRNDPTKTAKDLGYVYLPQEVVSKEEYEEYVSKLKEVDLDSANTHDEIDDGGCATGVCPTR
jgi:ribonucleoside-triphosphate reductase